MYSVLNFELTRMNRHEFLMTFITIVLTLFSRTPQIQVLGAALLPPISQAPAPAPSPCLCSDNYSLIFADQRLATVYPVIQKFKSLITLDPFNVTATWVGSDICSYTGFYCESPPDNKSALALASIDFNGFQLTAPTLDGFIDQLPDIALFHANSNNFGGTIPSNIANLPYLYEFDISNNRFSGPFPDAVLTVQGLSFLDLRFNSFSGSVPPQLFTNDLDALFLNNNNFMSRLPKCIGRSSSHLILLTLANNKFFGPIPRTLYKALSGNLTEILLFNNRLTGCLPYELGLLKQVIVFDAGNNYVTGPLPYSLGCLQNLEILNFAGNLLYGHVPEALCRLGNLANLSLSNNYFTGFGHSCWKLIKNGVLDLKKNCIPGLPLQRSFDECVDFFSYYPIHYCPYFPVHYHMYMSCGTPPWENYGLGIHELATPPSN